MGDLVGVKIQGQGFRFPVLGLLASGLRIRVWCSEIETLARALTSGAVCRVSATPPIPGMSPPPPPDPDAQRPSGGDRSGGGS